MASGLPDFYRPFDLAMQSLTSVDVDIVAAAIGSLSVDLVAQTIANLDIDIIAQSVGNIEIDVVAQALSEITNRPKYGGGISAAGEFEAVASTNNELVAVTGKGMIYGGFEIVDYNSTQKASIMKLEVDGELVVGESFEGMNLFGLKRGRGLVGTLLAYDEVNFVYAAALSYGLTFETGFKLYYHELEGTTPTVNYRAVYAIV